MLDESRTIILASILIVALPISIGQAQTQTDITAIAGAYSLSDGYENRVFATVFGNALFSSGLGTHVETHYIDREENGAFFTGGLSYNVDRIAAKLLLGTSSEVDNILPELFSRLSMDFRSDPATGLIVSPAYSYRSYRSGREDQSVDVRLVKYFPIAPATSLIVEGVIRESFLSTGQSWVPSGSIGATYSVYKSYGFGVTFDGGRANYGEIDVSEIDEPYFSVRPSFSAYLSENVEVFVRGDYTSRESYDAVGGIVGMKIVDF